MFVDATRSDRCARQRVDLVFRILLFGDNADLDVAIVVTEQLPLCPLGFPGRVVNFTPEAGCFLCARSTSDRRSCADPLSRR